MKEKVIEKIRKLIAHQESAAAIGSVEEAKAFAQKIQELLFEHELEISQIPLEARDAREETIGQECFDPSDRGWTGTKRQYWLLQLAKAVSRGHMCELLVSRSSNTVYFVGKPHNRAVAAYMYEVLIRTARNLNLIEYTKAARENKKRGGPKDAMKGFISAFYEAFALEIGRRYQEIRNAADAGQTMALVLRSTEQALEKYMSQFRDGVSGPRPKGYHEGGAEAGRRVARSVNLDSRGVEAARGGRKQLS